MDLTLKEYIKQLEIMAEMFLFLEDHISHREALDLIDRIKAKYGV